MLDETLRHNRPISNHPHPFIRRAMIALALWMLLWVWTFFGGHGDTGLVLAVVSFFVLVIVILGSVLHRIWRRGERVRAKEGGGETDGSVDSLREWLSGDFRTAYGSVSGKDAAVGILLPIAAVTIGMSLFAIILHLAV